MRECHKSRATETHSELIFVGLEDEVRVVLQAARLELRLLPGLVHERTQSADSAEAYEKYLAHYGGYEQAEQVELMLGLLYARYLHEPVLAIKHLQAAVGRLSDPGQLKMCKDELDKLQD